MFTTDTGVKDLPDTEPVISSSATKFPPSILILLLIGSTSVILPSDDTLVTFSPNRNLWSCASVGADTISVVAFAIAYWPWYFFVIYSSNIS